MLHLAALAAGVGFAACLLLTPLVRRLAVALDVVDRPDETRKLHSRTTPLGGGIAVLSGFWIAVLCLPLIWTSSAGNQLWDPRFVGCLLLASLIICAVGLIDDTKDLRGRQKLLGQILAATVLITGGVYVDHITVFSWNIDLGVMAIPFTMFWLLGAINALNLLDGMDGLATSIGIVLSLGLSVMAIMGQHTADAILTAAIAGALLGFLIYNLPPASIFLGDAGSMLIGMVLGAMAIRASLKGPATIALAAPTAIWAIPILDMGMAILRRKLTGRSLYTTDRGHLHHSLARRGFPVLGSVAMIGLLCAITTVAAVVSVYINHESLAVISVLAVVTMLGVSRLFGHQEFLLLFRRLKNIGLSLVPFHRSPREPARELRARLLGEEKWEGLWSMLIDFAEAYELDLVQLNVHLPAIDEAYHATWQRNGPPDMDKAWHASIPFVVQGQPVGRLKLTSSRTPGSACANMGDIVAALKPFEVKLEAIVSSCMGRATAAA